MTLSSAYEAQPIVLVGMPRSGSTMLTRILNESPSHYVINDFYALQIIDATESWINFKNREAQLDFLKYMTMMVVHRSGIEGPTRIDDSTRLTRAELDAILERIEPSKVAFGNWAFTIEFVMNQIGIETGRTNWGWNTPQDHHHIDKIKKAFPRAKILFLARNPAAILRSYKNFPDKGAASRYHPIAQSLAWKKSLRNFFDAQKKYGSSIYLSRYEDILNNAENAINEINKFLDSQIPLSLDLASIGTNSSYRNNNGATKELYPLEAWFSDQVVFSARKKIGYCADSAPFSCAGTVDTFIATGKFLKYYSTALVKSRDIRKRVLRLIGL